MTTESFQTLVGILAFIIAMFGILTVICSSMHMNSYLQEQFPDEKFPAHFYISTTAIFRYAKIKKKNGEKPVAHIFLFSGFAIFLIIWLIAFVVIPSVK